MAEVQNKYLSVNIRGDSQGRVYVAGQGKIARYSADLSAVKVFTVHDDGTCGLRGPVIFDIREQAGKVDVIWTHKKAIGAAFCKVELPKD